MKVIFTDRVTGVAFKGDVKNVRNGFYRNFLQPRHKAVPATKGLLAQWEERRKKLLIEKEQIRSKLEEMKGRLAEGRLKIEKKVTAKGTLYGGLKAADIAKSAKEQLHMEIPEEAIVLSAPIKSVGTYEVKLHLGENVDVMLPLEVVKKE